jgi:hypothetical protein
MKRMLLAATFLVAIQLGVPFAAPVAALAQSADQPSQAASDAPAPASDATPHRKHRHRRTHQATTLATPAAPVDAPQDAAAPASAPSHGLAPTQAMLSMSPPEAPARPAAASPAAAKPVPASGEMTPMGAIRAGNAEGTIPAWTGGLTARREAAFVRSRPDPFAAERPLFSITAQNVDRYADKLAAGTVAMLRTIRGYHVDVYATHRTFAAPQYIYDNAVANMSRAHLVHHGEGVEGAALSVPFPVPRDGYEAMWNHILRWRGTQIVRTVDNVISTPGGDYSLQKWHEDIMLPYNIPGFSNTRSLDSLFRQEVLAPPRDAGALTLVINHQDPYDQAREAWSYNPGERRVRRAPEIDYDTPLTDTDGLETVDDYDMFNGALDRYDWKLLGRKEMYVPYNTNKMQDPSTRYSDLIGPEAVNPDYIRFELHRVWVVDARLKPEFRHIYTRRTMYLDEDSWQCLISDRYDGRGNLWRTALAFPAQMADVPVFVADGYEYVDLYQHRYMLQGMHSQEPQAPAFDASLLTMRDYSAEALRRMGHR